MSKSIITVVSLLAVLLLATSVGAEPLPRFVSGTMQTGSLVNIFGEEFGEVPQDRIPSRPNPSSVADVFGVVAGDGPDWFSCTKHHRMPLEAWGRDQITFWFQEGKIPELTEFYLFVVDAEGQASAGIGPWMVGMGIEQPSPEKVQLLDQGNQLTPDLGGPGVPTDASLGPGAPSMVSLSTQSKPAEQVFHLKVTNAAVFVENFAAKNESEARMKAWVGDTFQYENCLWIEETEIAQLKDDGMVCAGTLDQASPEDVVYLFVADEEGRMSPGLMATVTEGAPARPGKPVLFD